MAKNEIEQVLKLADILERRVIGQRYALEAIAKRIKTSRARLDNPNRPVGVFMLVGPSGTGKTETALTLAEALYGGEQNLIKINMAEFQEAHTVSTLKGSPPGYVGYGEGGVLTEAVRRRPYSVVLLDEIEKAHPDVHEIFFEVFDKGHMEDGEGRDIDFKNTIIILTSNAAQDVIINMCKDPDLMPDAEAIEKAMRPHLVKAFPDALLNRLAVVPFFPISKEMLRQIIRLNLSRVEKRVKENHKVPFTFDESVPEFIGTRRRTGWTATPHGRIADNQHDVAGDRAGDAYAPGGEQGDQPRSHRRCRRQVHVRLRLKPWASPHQSAETQAGKEDS